MSEDPRFYNPNGEPITLVDGVEFEEMIRLLAAPKEDTKK
jgi:hypothetical protein